jgi:hypothetical protein
MSIGVLTKLAKDVENLLISLGDYQNGLVLSRRNQVFEREGEYFHAAPGLALPYTTTGDWDTELLNFASVGGDFNLRQDLNNLGNPSKGSSLIAGVARVVNSVAEMQALTVASNQNVFVMSYWGDGKGGGGPYKRAAPGYIGINNYGSVIQAHDGGFYLLQYNGSVDATSFGVREGDITAATQNTLRMQSAMDNHGNVTINGNYFWFDGILYYRPGLFISGNAPGPATADAGNLPGGTRLKFIGNASTCFSQKDMGAMLHHCGLSNLSFETDSRDWLMDMRGMLGWTISGVRMENLKVNGGGLRSQQIGALPTWLNHCIDVEIRVLDDSTAYNWDVDWSDSDLVAFGLTGGMGAIDRGPGNMNYLGGICDRAKVGGAGLWVTGSVESNKQLLISNVKFDDNNGYGLVLDAHLNTTGVFSPTVTGCVFRNPNVATAYDILIINVANASKPVMRGGVIVGNTFSLASRIPFNVDDTTWTGITFGCNRYDSTFATPFTPVAGAGSENFFAGSNGISVPNGPVMARSNAVIRSLAQVSMFLTGLTGDAGLVGGAGPGGTPFIGASRTVAGVATNLNFITDNLSRWILADNGTAFYPSTDSFSSIGLASMRTSLIFSATGTINTSDAREKDTPRSFTTNELAASRELGESVGVWRFLTAIAEKGDAARQHIGMTVQHAIEVMESHGLDPMAYGFICYDEWDAVAAEVDEEGTVIRPAVAAGSRYGFRTDQLSFFLIRGLVADNAEIKARLTAAGI